MNLFARILSHGFALVVVALLALGLIYRGELFPEWELPEFLALGQKPVTETKTQDSAAATAEAPVPAPVAAEPAPSPTAGAEVAADESAPQTAPLPSETVEEAGQDTAAAVAAVPSDVEDQGASGPADALTGDLAAGAAAGVEPAGQTAEATVPGADETPAVTPEPAEAATDLTAGPEAADAGTAGAAAPVAVEAPAAEAAPDTAADTGQVRAEPAATTTPYRVLAAAREAYWLRDYAAAEQKYQELIALDPDNPDGYGELGNMYFSQGDWEKASAAYYEAGTRLATEGLYDRARQLVEVIRGLNGGQADDLEQQIEVAESAAP